MELPSVSIIIPNYNGREYLGDCLSSIFGLNYLEDRLEVLLVDNASVDDSCEFVEQNFPEVKIIRNRENLGFSGGINTGSREAAGDYLVFLNSDMRVDKNWLAELVTPLIDGPVKCAGSKVLNWDGSSIDFAGRRSDIFALGFEPLESKEEVEGSMLFASGGAIAIEKDVYFDAGGLDDDYHMYHEDVDLGWRLWLLGYEVVFVPGSIVYHVGAAASGKVDASRIALYYQRNAMFTLIKNLDEKNFWRFLPPFFDFLIRRSKYVPGAGEAFVSALYDAFFEHLDMMLDKRDEIQGRRRRSDEEIFSMVGRPYESIFELGDYRGPGFKDRKHLKKHITKLVFEAYKREIQSQQKRINELSSVLDSHETTFRVLDQSIIWQILRGYDLIIGKILPLGSGRRKCYEGCVDGVRRIFSKIRSIFFKRPVELESAREYRERVNTVPAKSADKVDILCFPITGWNFRFQRPQQLLSLFARDGHRIFYIDVGTGPEEEFSVRKLGHNIFELMVNVPHGFNIYRDDWTEKQDHMKRFIESLDLAKARFGIDAVSLVVFPSWEPVASELRRLYGWKIVYDCLDDHESFPDIHPKRVEEEKKLFKESNLVIVTSSSLAKKAEGYREDVALIRNATDFEHFKSLPYNELLKMTKPVVGYYGAVAPWFDSELVEYLAESRTDWNFVIIGRMEGASVGRLRKLPNVHFLGEKLYSYLPKYLFHFDVCIIPFKITPFIEAADQLKFYEYISSGKPVVSTNIPELRKYRDLCYLADGRTDFLDKLETALLEDDSLKKKRVELARENTWENRYQIFSSHIERMLQK